MKIKMFQNLKISNIGLGVLALLIVVFTLWYTDKLAKDIAAEEKQKVELIANTFKQINVVESDEYRAFLLDIIINNNTVPVILADESDNISVYRNLAIDIDEERLLKDTEYKAEIDEKVKVQLEKMKLVFEPIEIIILDSYKNYIYYDESLLLKELRYFPYVQLAIISIFIIISYVVFNTSRRSEQNKVWVGMAKETAHQLGTPISSLMGWVEYFKSMPKEDINFDDVLPEISKDINRLNQITERFSKIGGEPELRKVNISDEVDRMVNYIKKRSPRNVQITNLSKGKSFECNMNVALFGWVLENLMVNALNSIADGKGTLTVELGEINDHVFIDVKDSGKGIPKAEFKKVFKPGFTTKKRGWGLGLSLARRIVEDYHKGKIFVKESVMGEGTTFRIELKKA